MPFARIFTSAFFCVMTLQLPLFAQEQAEEQTEVPSQPEAPEPTQEQIEVFKGELEDLTSEFEALRKTVLETKERQEEVKKQLESIRAEMEGVRDLAKSEASKVSEKISGDLDEVGEEIERVSKNIAEAADEITVFKGQIDTLKGVVQYYYLTEKKIPEIDEEILHVLELPEVRYKVELRNGTIVVGDILSENMDAIVMQTTIGKLVIQKDFISKYEERFYTGPRVEFAGDYEVREFPDREEFIGRVRNVGEKRADFVEITFFLWDATTESVGSASTFVDGRTTRFRTGVISDASIEPGGTGRFYVIVPKAPGKNVAYRTKEIKWRQYE